MSDIQVSAGGNLQAAIDSAQAGDTITVEAGASFLGPFTFPPRSGFVTVRSSRLAEFPAGRVGKSAPFARIIADNVEAAIIAQPQGSFWKFEGIEVCTTNPALLSYGLVRIGESDQTLADVPRHFTFDRCYIHALPTQDIQRGVTMNGASIDILNCRIDEIHWRGVEAQALGGWNGPGPFNVVNNHLEAAGINILFGGAQASIPGLVPSDIVISGNTLFKPLSWRVGDPSYAGYHWTVKNLFELKNARRLKFTNNVLENSWADAQVGWAIIFNSFRDHGEVVEDIEFTQNIIRHCASGINLRGMDSYAEGCDQIRMRRVNVADNTLEDIGAYGGEGKGYQLLNGSEDVTFNHNTSDCKHDFLLLHSCGEFRHTRLKVINNLAPAGSYAVFGDGGYFGTDALNRYAADWQFQKNAIYNLPTAGLEPSRFPPDNYFPADLAASTGLLGTDGQPVGARAVTPIPPDPIPPDPVPPDPTPVPPPSITAPSVVTIPRNKSGVINVTLSDLTVPVTVTVEGSTGQVQVSPLSRVASPTSSILAFSVKVKQQSRTITFRAPFGSAVVQVRVV